MMDRTPRKRLAMIGLSVAAAVALMVGCTTSGEPAARVLQDPTQETSKTGAELWAETCLRCHNFRSPADYSDTQWAVALSHMRIRANLTGEEQRKILEFLQSGN